MASMNVALPDPIRDWVQQQRIDKGHCASVNEYVLDLIRRDQMEAEDRQAIVAAFVEGEQSGVSGRSVLDIMADVKAEWAHRDE